MGLLELAPSPEQNSKHHAPQNLDHYTTGKHDFANGCQNDITEPPEVSAVRGPRLRAVERRQNQQKPSARRLSKPAFAGVPKLCGAFG
eukprot:767607-Alexandrium_andersonii.AAC.1